MSTTKRWTRRLSLKRVSPSPAVGLYKYRVMIIGSPLASISGPGVADTNAICLPSGDHEPGPIFFATQVRDPMAIRRPARARRAFLVVSQADRFAGRRVHDPHLRVRSAGSIRQLDAVRDARGVRRDLDVANRAQLVEVAALQAASRRRAGERRRENHGADYESSLGN